MKKLLLLLLLLTFSLNAQSYTEQWSKIEKLESKNLFKSSLKEVESLYARAKKDANEKQLLKALLYKVKYVKKGRSSNYLHAINLLEKELLETKNVNTRLILKSMLAEFYAKYLKEIGYRTRSCDAQVKNVACWSNDELSDKASQLYMESLGEEAKSVDIKEYKTILTKAQNSEGLRPTLYDFLVFRALEYFGNSRNYLSTPIYRASLDEKEVFLDRYSFVNHVFQVTNEKSFIHKTLLLYQKLLEFHEKSGDERALEHINLLRLAFVHRFSILEDRDKYYVDALKLLALKEGDAEVFYYLAKYYFSKEKYKKALSYANRGIESRDSYILQESLSVKEDIVQKNIRLEMEKVNLPDENILAKVYYWNVETLFVRVVKLNEESHNRLNSMYEEDENEQINKYIASLDSMKEFQIKLPSSLDYKEHITEISLGAYGYGHYLFLFSKDKTFKYFNKAFSAVSKIAYFSKNGKLLLVDRVSGKALKGVEAKLYLSKHNTSTALKKQEFMYSKISDENGILTLPTIEHEYGIHLKHGEDSIRFARGNAIDDGNAYSQKVRESLSFFTDRAIYRPNQKVYFKALATSQRGNGKAKILTNKKLIVSLYVGRGRVESKQFVSNEFGTINGFFVIPKHVKLGSLMLKSNIAGRKRISVEEYKRPKFSITFEKLDKSYKLRESISVRGEAKSYAGASVDGVKVSYRVSRKPFYPWIKGASYNWDLNHREIEITKGEAQTDENGKFEIDFRALINDNISSKLKANYRYRVSVKITDSTGETHLSSKSITMGIVSANAKMLIDHQITVNSEQTLLVETVNLDNGFEALRGKVIIEKFKRQKDEHRARYWDMDDIDKVLYTKEEFQELFKNYKSVNKEKREKVFIKSIDFDTGISKALNLGIKEQGEYLLTLETKDRYAVKFTKEKKLLVNDLSALEAPYATALWDETDAKTYEVGSVAKVHIKTSSPNSYVYFTLEKNDETVEEKWLKISDLHEELINIENEDRGDIFYHLKMVENNRAYSSYGRIQVPWKKKLKIEYISFRDKMKPNEEEQWRIKISAEGQDKVSAEMVATMYDASLDGFRKHDFQIRNLFPKRYASHAWRENHFTALISYFHKQENFDETLKRTFYELNKFNGYAYRKKIAHFRNVEKKDSVVYKEAVVNVQEVVYADAILDVFSVYDGSEAGGDINPISMFELESVPIRKNFDETMFFKPNLKTDEEGNVVINFKTNGALTRWKFLAFAHTKELQVGFSQKELVTQKELMVVSNLPRFFREKDKVTLTAKVVNMSQKNLTAFCQLKLVNPVNNEPIYPDKNFTREIFMKKGTSRSVSFEIEVPSVEFASSMQHTFIAKTKLYSDAEQVVVPVLSNKELVLESKVVSLQGNEIKVLSLDAFLDNNSTTLKNHRLTIEFTSNPIWYALKSMPYLMEFPHECNEQLFNRYFANALATKLLNSKPKIKKVFDSWKSKGQLKSALKTNKALKSILLEETPWVLDAKSEEESQQRLAELFDLYEIAKNKKTTLSKLFKGRKSSGAWSWIASSKYNWYITQYILEGFGKLRAFGIQDINEETLIKTLHFIDRQMLVEYGKNKSNLAPIVIHYMYTRSFYGLAMTAKVQIAHAYYLNQIEKHWAEHSLYEQGMIALTLHKLGKLKVAEAIVQSLKERATVDENGMHFPYLNTHRWNQMPIETHALMMTVFSTITHDTESVKMLKDWLISKRGISHWKTTKATASAIYALLLEHDDLNYEKLVNISFDTNIAYEEKLKKAKLTAQKGTGHFKVSFDKFDKSMAKVQVVNPNPHKVWGGVYWQYIEDISKIKTTKKTALKIKKKLFLVRGKESIALENQALKVGDKVKVQLEVSSDQEISYLMIKDSRASTFEPLNVLSKYKWKNGHGYYESTRDNATYFFVDRLKAGTYIFEYLVLVNHKGIFVNGIAKVESMYAPEFNAHSVGGVVEVGE